MGRFTILRGMAHIVARLVVRPGRGGHPIDRWQDKSREVRRGRLVGERKQIRRFARGAITHHSLPIRTTPSMTAATRTSRAHAA